MTTAFLFPGQGSQFIGMGKSLAEKYPAAKQVFDEVDSALAQNLSHLMWEGDITELTLTTNSQPALMAVSLAVMRVLESETGLNITNDIAFVAGHSLGEYSALAAAGSLNLSDTARLLRIRGNAMQSAVPLGEGTMAAILGLNFDEVKEIASQAAQNEVCEAANDNAPGQVVISGHKAAVERAIALALEKGAKRGILLPVSAPFHCSLMQPAAEAMQEALEKVELKKPKVPIFINVDAKPVSEATLLKEALVRQVTGVVRWRESIINMASLNVDKMVEIGAGKILTTLAKRIDPKLTLSAIGQPEDIPS